jgi:hypothetical protein
MICERKYGGVGILFVLQTFLYFLTKYKLVHNQWNAYIYKKIESEWYKLSK